MFGKGRTAVRRDTLLTAAWGKPCPDCGQPITLGQTLVVRQQAVRHQACPQEALCATYRP